MTVRFLTGCHKRRLNYRLSVILLGLVLGVSCVYFWVICEIYLVVVSTIE